jgi:hypothetical protein
MSARRIAAILAGGVLITGGAIGLCYEALGHGGIRVAVAEQPSRPSETPSATVKASPSASPAASVAPSISPTLTPTPNLNPSPVASRSATTSAVVRLRKTPSTSADIITEVPSGVAVVLGAYSDAVWQQVTYEGVSGYISRTYLTY